MRFVPVDGGSFEGELRITHEGGVLGVALRGVAAVPPACGDSECHRGVFDPALGACRQVPLADGAACESRCLDAPTCAQGRCVGKPKSCDDGNVCTTDTCDPVAGCRHVDTTAQCPKPANPCRVAVCEPESGCGESDAADYTPCGEVTCAAANVCLAGACVAFEPPDGFPCSPETPCRAAGTCKAKQCSVPVAGPLATAWSYAPAEKHFRARLEHADADGNLYLREAPWGGASSCGYHYQGDQEAIDRCAADFAAPRHRVVSFTPEGALRWSHTAAASLTLDFVDHGRVWTTVASTQIQVLNAADGSVVATVQAPNHRYHVGDRLVVGSRWLPASGRMVLTGFDVRDAAELWTKFFPDNGEFVSGDAAVLSGDRVAVVLRDNQQAVSAVVLLDAAGNELARHNAPAMTLALMASRDFLLFDTGTQHTLEAFDAQAAAFTWKVDYLQQSAGSRGAMVGADSLFMLLVQQPTPTEPFQHRLEARRRADGQAFWNVRLETTTLMNDLWLTNRSSVLIEQQAGHAKYLAERRSSDGSELYACPINRDEDVEIVGRGRVY
ncbi:MAG: hypothetical protein ACK4N5_16220, partial [Myxococcales bacterium]